MTYLEKLTGLRDKLIAIIDGEFDRQLALVVAGDPPEVTYSAGGKSTDWNGWLNAALGQLDKLNQMVVSAGGSWEYVTRARSG